MRSAAIVSILYFSISTALAQGPDTTKQGLLNSKLAQEIVDALTVEEISDDVKKVKSEAPFLPFQGKIIRRIIIKTVGFENTITDTSRNIKTRIVQIADMLHADTRASVIRDNLFFHENSKVNPYKMADNERYLRDLDFILDSRIVVKRVKGSPDSVDVEVRTRDVFSLGVRGDVGGIDKYSVGVYDANLMGQGQRLEGNVLVETDRSPNVGIDVRYSKVSLFGSLTNVFIGYTQLNNNISVGEENEYAYYLRLDRPLVSPYSRMAGGLELSKNWSKNVYSEKEGLFRNYSYVVKDLWVGYNIGIRNTVEDRNRHFVALRYFNQDFAIQPNQESELQRVIYNDRLFLLGEITFYRQNFYKTNYIYGFGRTEDVPYGLTTKLTWGWTEELGMKRWYGGVYVLRRFVQPSGRFFDIEAGASTFYNKGNAEDGVMYVNGVMFSKAYDINRAKVRHQFSLGYAKSFSPRARELLTLNNELRGFSPDSLYGHQRLRLTTETTVFTNYKLLGFKFAPFLGVDGAFFQEKRTGALFDNFYWSITGGVRIRNENLIFGTIEVRAFYFPTRVEGVQPLKLGISTNLRLKYSADFVQAPYFVRYNR